MRQQAPIALVQWARAPGSTFRFSRSTTAAMLRVGSDDDRRTAYFAMGVRPIAAGEVVVTPFDHGRAPAPDIPSVVQPLPVPTVIEDDSETAWRTWDYWARKPIHGEPVDGSAGVEPSIHSGPSSGRPARMPLSSRISRRQSATRAHSMSSFVGVGR